MAVISAKIKLVDDMSKKLDALASKSRETQQMINSIGTSASSFDKVSNGTQSAEEKLSKLCSRAKSADTDLKKCEGTSRSTAVAVEKMGENFGNSEESIRELCQNALDRYNNTVNSSTKSTEEFAEAVTVSGDATAGIVDKEGLEQLQKLISSTAEAEEELQDYSETAEKSSKSTEKLGESQKKTREETEKTREETEKYKNTNKEAFEALDGLIASAGVVMFLKNVYDGFKECITAANEYETSLAKVSTLADTSAVPMSKIGDDILSLSQKTGQAATDLSEAEYQALSAGVSTVNATEFVEKANKLAVGGFTSSATAVDVLTTAVNAYQLEASQADKISDTLIMTQNLGKTTVDELASSMGRVIPSAAAYNVTIDDLSTSYAVMTANGIATAESTTYIKGMLNELAKEGSDVSDVLLEKTGKTFSQLEADGKSLGDVMDILGSSVDYDSTAFANLWSSQEAGTGALALLNAGTEKYNSTLSKMQNSLGTTDEAYKTMTNTAEYTSQKLQNAGTNFQIAVGNAMVPATNKFNEAMTNVLTGLTSFIDKHPGAVRATAAVATGVGVVTAAIVGYTAVTKLATVVTAALKVVTTALSNPVFLVVTAVTAGVAALATWCMSQEEAADETENLSASSKKQYEELEQLRGEYQALCDEGQKNSYQAEELKYKIDELNASYETNKQTVEELNESHEELQRQFSERMEKHEQAVEKINDEEASAKNLIERLRELGGKSKLTAAEQSEMGVVVDILNQKMPSLGLTYKNVASDIEGSVGRIDSVLNTKIAQDRYNEAFSTYFEFSADKDNYQKIKAQNKAQLDEEQKKYDGYLYQLEDAKRRKDELLENWDIVNWALTGDYDISNWQEQVDEQKATLDSVKVAYEASSNVVETNQKIIDDAYSDMIKYSAEQYGIVTEEANEVSGAIAAIAPTVIESAEALAGAYDEAYNSALTSIQGQYTLWDEVGKVSEITTGKIMSNLDEQTSYWKSYADNIEKIQSMNIDGMDDLLATIDDGSKESYATIAAMASANKDELEKIVAKNKDLQDEQGRTAEHVSKLTIGFDKAMDDIQNSAKETIKNMELSDDAKKSATDTINAYVQSIRDGVSSASSAAEAVKQAVENKLKSTNATVNVNVGGSVDGLACGSTYAPSIFIAGENGPELIASKATKAAAYANGTTKSEDFFIAGENGPELIVGQQGSTVFPTGETDRLINALNRTMSNDPITSSNVTRNIIETEYSPIKGSSQTSGEKVITVRIEGAGSVSVSKSSGNNKDEIVDIMTEQLKPILIGILNDEIYEEGDDSYEY